MPIATNIKEKSSLPDQCAPLLAISVNAIKAKMAMGISWGALRIIGNLEVKAEKSANISDPTRRMPIPCGRNPANGPVKTSAARAMADTIIIIPLIVPAIMSGIKLENLDSDTMNHFMLARQMMRNLQYQSQKNELPLSTFAFPAY